jgi:hypothetical protein
MVLGPDTQMKDASNLPGGSSRKTFMTTPVVMNLVISEKTGAAGVSNGNKDDPIACPFPIPGSGWSAANAKRININSITLSSFNLGTPQTHEQ